jgi:hypothetical protein
MIKAQALEGVPYMRKALPAGMDNEELFDYLKERITYKHDPKGIELVHTPKSFFEDNYHGKAAHGDCDDFSVIGIAALKAQGVPEGNISVVLTGRSKKIPRHIYLQVKDQIFDLTNDSIGEERKYPFKQVIPLPLL